jgi:hypothetical protein
MKNWKEFKINESNHFLELKEMIEDIKDILIELDDNDINYRIHPEDDIQIKLLSFSIRDLISTKIDFYILINFLDFSKNQWLISTFKQLENYLLSNNFKLQYIVSVLNKNEIHGMVSIDTSEKYDNIDSVLYNHSNIFKLKILILY